MFKYLQTQYNLDDPNIVSALDDTSMWSYPPGYAILKKIPYRKGMNVLDIGFGPGFPLVEIAMCLGKSSRIYGIDPWKGAIERAKLKIAVAELSNVEIVEGVAENMPFADNFFDLIVSNNGLNNVENLSRVLNECNRVSKPAMKLIFTFNLEATFIEFYSVYREVVRELGMPEFDEKISEHIHHKRRPVVEVEHLLSQSGFSVRSKEEKLYHYRFLDGTAMLNHFFIKVGFIDPWREILPEDRRERVFNTIEEKLNAKAEAAGGFSMQVPFVILECEKTT